MSEKGQVVIPKVTRDRMRLIKGARFEIVERPDGVLLKMQPRIEKGDFDELTARIRSRVKYEGPSIPIEDMDAAITAMWAKGGPSWDK